MPFPWLPWSISVMQHSSRAPDGLWTLASIRPFAPFRLTANDAGWFTFKPDSCSTTHTRVCHNISEPKSNVYAAEAAESTAPLQHQGLSITYLEAASKAKEQGFDLQYEI